MTTEGQKIYFFPHRYLRDRHLDTIRRWPQAQVLNAEVALQRQGAQVSREKALAGGRRRSWRQRVPLLNLKRRPAGIPDDALVYSWGAVIVPGPYLLDLDIPYALVGYNLDAMRLWRPLLRRALTSSACRGIRCMSGACRETLRALFGDEVAAKAEVHYPRLTGKVHPSSGTQAPDGPRFVFVGTQFELKGGPALLRAFRAVVAAVPTARLDLITHLPEQHRALADAPGVSVHPATMSRGEVWTRFLSTADVLVHPTYVDSFGMVVLEALAHGLAVVATDVYALREMVADGENGRLLIPPVSIWDGVLPAPLFHNLDRAESVIARVDTSAFEAQLAAKMLELATDREALTAARAASCSRYETMFAP